MKFLIAKYIPILGILLTSLLLVIPQEQEIDAPVVERPQKVETKTVVEIEIVEDTETVVEEVYPYLIEVTQEDIDLMARVVMSESSILPSDAKQAIAQTIVNRVKSDKFPNTVKEVVYQENQYSTADNGTPNYDCYFAVESALLYTGFPEDMYYFRADKPHDFAYFYCKIGNTYFNTSTNHN